MHFCLQRLLGILNSRTPGSFGTGVGLFFSEVPPWIFFGVDYKSDAFHRYSMDVTLDNRNYMKTIISDELRNKFH